MKPLFLIVNSMLSEISVERAAKEMGVSGSHAYKFCQDTQESGQTIPVEHLFKLIRLAASEDTNKRLQQILDELLAYFAAPARRKVVHEGAILDLEEALKILKNGSTKEEKERVAHCPECFAPMRVEG